MAAAGKTPKKQRGRDSGSSSAQGPSGRGSSRLTVFTVGHSTRPIEEFISMLRGHGIRQLADVRTIPRSRHNPQFGQDELGPALKEAGIHYLHMSALGGLRHARRDSVNTAWRNASFRGYADYMGTEAFASALEELISLARKHPTAVMCAEAVPWRCHRSLIGDALLARGIDVEEIASATRTQPRTLTPWARVSGTSITYPGTEGAPEPENPASARVRRSTKTG